MNVRRVDGLKGESDRTLYIVVYRTSIPLHVVFAVWISLFLNTTERNLSVLDRTLPILNFTIFSNGNRTANLSEPYEQRIFVVLFSLFYRPIVRFTARFGVDATEKST